MKLTTVGLLGLAGLAALQGLVLFGSRSGPEGDLPWIQAGDALGQIGAAAASGTKASLATGDTLLLLVFHSDCGHCQRVIPVWRDWIDDRPPDFDVVAVTSESREAAAAFLASFGWYPEIWTVGENDGPAGRRSLVTRTPWAFFLDGEGIVLGEAHGRLAQELAAGWSKNSLTKAGYP